MGIDNTGECLPCPLSLGDFNQEIDILREKDVTQSHRAIQQKRISQLLRSILFRS